jgi:hypothetical protein
VGIRKKRRKHKFEDAVVPYGSVIPSGDKKGSKVSIV